MQRKTKKRATASPKDCFRKDARGSGRDLQPLSYTAYYALTNNATKNKKASNSGNSDHHNTKRGCKTRAKQ